LANNQEYAIETYQNKFDEKTTVEDFEKQATLDGWNDNLTFMDFEKQFGFTSLRPTYEEKLTKWGENGLLENDPNNPDHCLPFSSLPVLTVLNEKAVLGCEGKLYKFMNNGVIYEITDGDIATIDKITAQYQMIEFVAPNVNILNKELLGTFKTEASCYSRGSNFENYETIEKEHVQDKIQLFYASSLFSFA
jgi:hypothetical protein